MVTKLCTYLFWEKKEEKGRRRGDRDECSLSDEVTDCGSLTELGVVATHTPYRGTLGMGRWSR
jgi:hypothetical protein